MKNTQFTTIKVPTRKDTLQLNLLSKKAYSLSKKKKESLLSVLEDYTNLFIKETFGEGIPNISLCSSGRMSTTQATYTQEILKGEVIKEYINIGNKTLSTLSLFYTESVIRGLDAILRHEATHYVLAYKGLNYKDGEADFEHTLASVGGLTSGVTKGANRVQCSSVGMLSSGYLKECKECKVERFFVKDSSLYICPDCSRNDVDDYVLLESKGLSVYVSEGVNEVQGQPLNPLHVHSIKKPKINLVEYLERKGK